MQDHQKQKNIHDGTDKNFSSPIETEANPLYYPDGRIEWRKECRRHRLDGPAVIDPDGSEHWFKNGNRHRKDDPAVIKADGSQEWWVNGKRHRDHDLPAVINANGRQEWWRNNMLHRKGQPAITYGTYEAWYHNNKLQRINGPALTQANGTQEWYKKGYLHRADGPAVIKSDGTMEWFIDGVRHRLNELTPELLKGLSTQIAAYSDQAINHEMPLLSATLPTGERVQIVIPPAARFGPALSIRKQIVQDMTLDDYQSMGAFENVAIHDAPLQKSKNNDLKELLSKGKIREFLSVATRAKKNILISGGTSTGKTTLLNSILSEIDRAERIITIEDTPEIRPQHPNHLSLLASKGEQGTAKVTIQDLLEAALRLRPDRILLGELRGKEAYTWGCYS